MSDLQVVIGLGVTGISCVRYLERLGVPFIVMDTRPNPPQLAAFQAAHPTVKVLLGPLDTTILASAKRIILSPGVALATPEIAAQVARGIPVIGDVELFAEAVTAPVIAITGTNAKSTVTTLVGKMAAAAGYRVQVGGNLGEPTLDLLTKSTETNLFVLELSSFQLETTFSLKPQVATVLNISPDHMDRYQTVADYQRAKHRVYAHCGLAVYNRDDILTYPTEPKQPMRFTLETPGEREFGLLNKDGELYLAYETTPLLAVRELPVIGKHYQANALAALALGYGFGFPLAPMIKVLREFTGLPHRCQLVRERRGVRWYNDSKGTNVGATQAAIEGLGGVIEGKLVLIAGGIGKNADFSSLVPTVIKYARHVVLIGQAADDIAKAINDAVPVSFATTMADAVLLSDQMACPGDSVLLSPACASFDMFKHFEHRGEVFTQLVEAL